MKAYRFKKNWNSKIDHAGSSTTRACGKLVHFDVKSVGSDLVIIKLIMKSRRPNKY